MNPFFEIKKITFLLALLFLCPFVSVKAEDVSFNVQVLPAPSQIDKTQNYFNLKMEPGKKETIKIQINNNDEKEGKFSLAVHPSYTSNDGKVIYSEKKETHTSFPFELDKIISLPQTVTVPPFASKEVPIEIQMPAESFEGEILTGLQIKKELDDSDRNTSGITNQYAYLIGLRLTQTNQQVAKRKLELGNIQVEKDAGAPTLKAEIINPVMEPYGHMSYEMTLTKKGEKSPIITKEESEKEFAPNSTYSFSSPLPRVKLTKGTYQFKLVAKDALGNEWPFEENLKITEKDTEFIQPKKVTLGGDNTKWIVLFILLGSIIAALLIYIYQKNKKWKGEK